MIIVRAPLRVSFVGGGTDIPDFFHQYPGRVISTAIDKYVHILVNPTPLVDKITAKYTQTELVNHPNELEHTRLKAALLDLGIHQGLEIASFSDLPSKTGLGSSSSFSVALLKALHAHLGKKLDQESAAREAVRLELELLKEPVGLQDQYASAFGGFNIFQFNPDSTVTVRPVLLDYKKRLALEDHILLFYTGITRAASSVLTEQKANIQNRFETLKQMSDSVPEFESRLMAGDIEGMGKMLHEGWSRKKSLASNMSTASIDSLYEAGLSEGAWGGKILGAGGGGCILLLAKPEKHPAIRLAMQKMGQKHNLADFREVPVHFVQSGAQILYHGNTERPTFA